MTRKRSAINFDKTIFGINFTERGPQSFSKSIKVGPFQVTLNARESGIRGSIGIPGTGLSKRNIKLCDLPDLRTPDLPEHNRKPDMWSDNEWHWNIGVSFQQMLSSSKENAVVFTTCVMVNVSTSQQEKYQRTESIVLQSAVPMPGT